MALILEGTFDEEAIGSALSAREFEQTEVNGLPVWHRFEDAAINVMEREMADPFGGDLGSAARIAILPGYLANSRYWNMTEAITATFQGSQDALADNPNYRALAEAITEQDGLLIQAMFFNLADVGMVAGDPLAIMEGEAGDDPAEGYGPLMPFALAVLADRQEGQDQVHLIGLVYPDHASAEAAAQELARRISVFGFPQRPDEVIVEQFGAQVTASVYDSPDTNNAVAVVEVRYPLPEERINPDTGQFITVGQMYRFWVQAIMQRAFSPLWVMPE
jgi:hypothetical protein